VGADILSHLTAQGFRFAVRQGQLFVEPKDRLNDTARALIREHKAELLAVEATDRDLQDANAVHRNRHVPHQGRRAGAAA
jgi:TubC N-terminal docking domain